MKSVLLPDETVERLTFLFKSEDGEGFFLTKEEREQETKELSESVSKEVLRIILTQLRDERDRQPES